MRDWNFGGGEVGFRGGPYEVQFKATSDDTTGIVQGTLAMMKGEVVYNVEGHWAAAGSVPGRTNSAIFVAGSHNGDHTAFVTMNGTLETDNKGRTMINCMITLAPTDGEPPATYPECWMPGERNPLMKIFQNYLIDLSDS